MIEIALLAIAILVITLTLGVPLPYCFGAALMVMYFIGDVTMKPRMGSITDAYKAELRRLTPFKKTLFFTTLLFLTKESPEEKFIFCNTDEPDSSPEALIEYDSLAVAHFEGALCVQGGPF